MNLQRFLNPKSIAVFGGGWAKNVIEQLLKSGYQGQLWPVHPTRDSICGVPCVASIDELPDSPDAAFVGVNRHATIDVVASLQGKQCGGAICFASGFKESEVSHPLDASQPDLQSELVAAAANMPILGPNCYGYLNYLDNVCLWPDQHGGLRVDEGVAIIAQSSNIAINMTMQNRGLAITHMLTVGNQAQISVSELALNVLSDPRVKAVGFYLESFGDLAMFTEMAKQARALGKPLVVLKIGKSMKAQLASLTHTASLVGSAAGSSAFLTRLGIIEVDSISVLLETLKLLHHIGPLASANIASMSCSGGEASLMSDMAMGSSINYADLSAIQRTQLNEVLGDKVELANPLDYHTYVWGDVPTMTRCFEVVLKGDYALTVLVLDVPRADLCDPSGHDCAIEAIIAAAQNTGGRAAVLSLLPENLDESLSQRLLNAGVVPLHGMRDALRAIDALIRSGGLLSEPNHTEPVVLVDVQTLYINGTCELNEVEAKTELAKAGVPSPKRYVCAHKSDVLSAANQLTYPVVLKGIGIAHKTDANLVVLNIQSADELRSRLVDFPDCPQGYLLEQMIDDIVVELLVGVSVDSNGLMLLTIGAGGVLTELMNDTVSLCLPASRSQIQTAVSKLKLAKLLNGYRGKSSVNHDAMLDVLEAVARYACGQAGSLIELDINPIMVGTKHTQAADALIRLAK